MNAIVLIEKRVARVLGVGGHRLWLRVVVNGDLISLTEDSFATMWEKAHIEILTAPSLSVATAATSSSSQYCFEEEHDRRTSLTATRLNSIYSYDRIHPLSSPPTDERKNDIREFRESQMRELLVKSILSRNCQWNIVQDEALACFVQVLAKRYKKDVFSLSLSTLSANLTQLRSTLSVSRGVGSLSPLDVALQAVLGEHSDEDIIVRVLVLNLFNDLFHALHRLVMPHYASTAVAESVSSSSALSLCMDAPGSHPSSLVHALKSLIYASVKDEISFAMTRFSAKTSKDLVQQVHKHFSVSEREKEKEKESERENGERVNSVMAATIGSPSGASNGIGGAASSNTTMFSSTTPSNFLSNASPVRDVGNKKEKERETPSFLDRSTVGGGVVPSTVGGGIGSVETSLSSSTPAYFATPNANTVMNGLTNDSSPHSHSQTHSLVLEIEREEDLYLQLLWSAHSGSNSSSGGTNGGTSSSGNSSVHSSGGGGGGAILEQLLSDPAWHLYCRIQASYLGQFVRCIESFHCRFYSEQASLSLSPSTSTATSSLSTAPGLLWYKAGRDRVGGTGTGKDSAPTTTASMTGTSLLWEDALRHLSLCNIAGLWGQGLDALTSGQKVPPILVRPHRYLGSSGSGTGGVGGGVVSGTATTTAKTMEESKLQTMLLRSQNERRLFTLSPSQSVAPSVSLPTNVIGNTTTTVSSTTVSPSSLPLKLFDCFEVLDSNANTSAVVSDWTLFTVFIEETLEQIQSLIDSLYSTSTSDRYYSDNRCNNVNNNDMKYSLTAGEVSLLLQTMQSTGKCLYISYSMYTYVICNTYPNRCIDRICMAWWSIPSSTVTITVLSSSLL